MTTRRILAILLACSAGLVGCTHYVNIPRLEGDLAYHDPNAKAPRMVMHRALEKVLELRPLDEPFQVMLPLGTVPETYAQMLPDLSPHAMWSSDGRTKDVPIVRVSEVRIRGSRAEVDVVLPIYAGDGPALAQMVTAHLRYDPVSKWYVVRTQEWRRGVDQRREATAIQR